MLREFHIAGTSLPVEAPLGVRAAVPSAVDATFVISGNLAAPLNMRRVKPGALRSLLLLLTPLLVRPGPLRALPAYYLAGAPQRLERRREVAGSTPLFVFIFLEEPQIGSVTLLRPSPGKCADIAVRHRFRNLSDVVASAERAGGGSSWR